MVKKRRFLVFLISLLVIISIPSLVGAVSCDRICTSEDNDCPSGSYASVGEHDLCSPSGCGCDYDESGDDIEDCVACDGGYYYNTECYQDKDGDGRIPVGTYANTETQKCLGDPLDGCTKDTDCKFNEICTSTGCEVNPCARKCRDYGYSTTSYCNKTRCDTGDVAFQVAGLCPIKGSIITVCCCETNLCPGTLNACGDDPNNCEVCPSISECEGTTYKESKCDWLRNHQKCNIHRYRDDSRCSSCIDNDGDRYQDENCGGDDCNDNKVTGKDIHP